MNSTPPPPARTQANGSPSSGASAAVHQRRQSRGDLSSIVGAAGSPNGLGASNGNGSIIEEEEEESGEAQPAQNDSGEDQDAFLPLNSPTTKAFVVPNTTNISNVTPPPLPRGEHARKHSRIHERNLSAFFPRPGQAPGEGYGDTYQDPNVARRVGGWNDAPKDMPAANGGGWKATAQVDDDASGKSKASRRGHHHKRSVSHNFFSFSDPTQTDPRLATLNNLAAEKQRASLSPSGPTSLDSSPYLPAPSHLRSKYAHLPAPLRLFVFIALYLPLSTQLALALSVAQIVLGASLWVTGQSAESLATTGLGYLVVFDGMGGLSRVVMEGGKGMDQLASLLGSNKVDAGVRMPFGSRRLITLSHFSQAIYLLFSAVYVCKESVEHVLLLHGGNDEEGAHGAGHGGMGHGDAGMVGSNAAAGPEEGIILPIVLLSLSALFSLISAIALRNHQSLANAVAPSGLSLTRSRTRATEPSLLDAVTNPFTATVLVFSVGLVVSAHTIPGIQLAPLDKVVALLQSIAMFYVAYPAAVATGQVLLQTSPPGQSAQMSAIESGVRDIENHPLVVEVKPPHIWQLTPHSATAPSSNTSSSTSSKLSADASPLIATLVITVRPDASDSDILTITQLARDRCGPALKLGGEGGKGAAGTEGGELTVQVVRAEKGANVKFWAEGGARSPPPKSSATVEHAGHSHGHSHDHAGHGHSH
ncbi:cation efflux family-domain-containing protein [Leucosporidium creatinivorum]|uniref:Cation efflux family-domain-containing protein n=1 Tax=Leucosporidium creatinivorum TaxID=106004 RepID=A0A1Y2EQF1_9BASI|nr:cation efflux family-domain-containing protein [Leucosporidium creatinivorum]